MIQTPCPLVVVFGPIRSHPPDLAEVRGGTTRPAAFR